MNPFPAPTLLWIGFALCLLGCVLPILIILGVLASSLFLNLFSFTATVAGIFLGLVGAATLVREYRK
jgi:hypothetical protein